MNNMLRITLIAIVMIFNLIILSILKRKKIETKYAFLWIFSSILLLIIALFPYMFNKLSFLLGFEATSNMIFLFGFFILLYINFILTLIISKQKKNIVTLVQEISVLKYRFDYEVKKK